MGQTGAWDQAAGISGLPSKVGRPVTEATLSRSASTRSVTVARDGLFLAVLDDEGGA
ncbi:hypothetical protein ACT6QG_02330 [Xanthobacter sp. TB0136]|uniref:hypothetical protein n=1 Tax=Xanthobacter sp. TB0136 TaxID=3459177 RepID=UPI004039A649